jgi:UDP-glucose 4-epimerase
MSKKILITGGAGFIGSHCVVELVLAGFEPIIVDNFYNSAKGNKLSRLKILSSTKFADFIQKKI